jgi:hypothetical protein
MKYGGGWERPWIFLNILYIFSLWSEPYTETKDYLSIKKSTLPARKPYVFLSNIFPG